MKYGIEERQGGSGEEFGVWSLEEREKGRVRRDDMYRSSFAHAQHARL